MSETKQRDAKTVLERRKISPNWQAFLKTQKDVQAVKKKPAKKQSDVNTYFKMLRLEKKAKLRIASQEATTDKSDAENVANQAEDGLNNNVNKKKGPVLTKFIGMDCEMVGVGDNARESVLARVSLVNKMGDCIYDKFVKPREEVTDYRTPVSGIRKEDLLNGEKFEVVQKEVADILKGRILVGHALKHDIEVLFLSHPANKIRDTSKYQPFRTVSKGGTPSLKKLSKELLGVEIQSGEHSSVEDARAAMQIYSLHSRQWESTLKRRKDVHRNITKSSGGQA